MSSYNAPALPKGLAKPACAQHSSLSEASNPIGALRQQTLTNLEFAGQIQQQISGNQTVEQAIYLRIKCKVYDGSVYCFSGISSISRKANIDAPMPNHDGLAGSGSGSGV